MECHFVPLMSNELSLSLRIIPERTFVVATISPLTKHCCGHNTIYVLGTQRSKRGLTMVIKPGQNMHLIGAPLEESDP